MSQTNKKQALGKGIRALLNTIDEELKTADGVHAVSGQSTNNSTNNNNYLTQIVLFFFKKKLVPQ